MILFTCLLLRNWMLTADSLSLFHSVDDQCMWKVDGVLLLATLLLCCGWLDGGRDVVCCVVVVVLCFYFSFAIQLVCW